MVKCTFDKGMFSVQFAEESVNIMSIYVIISLVGSVYNYFTINQMLN